MKPSETITIDLLCACGTKCGELTLPATYPLADAPLEVHGIEKVECDGCRNAREKEQEQVELIKKS